MRLPGNIHALPPHGQKKNGRPEEQSGLPVLMT